MPYNNVVHGNAYVVSPAIVAAKRSALQAVQHLLQPIPGLSVAHRRELLSISLWKWTEAAGVPPHAKFNARYATPAALDHQAGIKVNHEHVWPRKWIIDQLLEPGSTWTEPKLRDFLEQRGIACIVTIDEHARLNTVSPALLGWDRYAAAGLQVRDLEGDGFVDLSSASVPLDGNETSDDDAVVLEADEEVLEPVPSALSVEDAFDQLSGDRAPLLKRLLKTAEAADGVGLIGTSKREGAARGAYVRIYDFSLSAQTRAAAYVHWTGRVSFALSIDDLPSDLAARAGVSALTHETYGVGCKVRDQASLATAEELLVLALERVRDEVAPREEAAEEQERGVTQGHVFVVQGAIGQLGADAAIVSTDDVFDVERSWHDVVSPHRHYEAARHQPAEWSTHGWGRDRSAQRTWFLDVTPSGAGGTDAFGRLDRVFSDIAAAGLTSTIRGRQLPLVVLPVIGTGLGGFDGDRGTVIDRLLTACETFVRSNPVDVAIVARSPASFAALQHKRRTIAANLFRDVDLERAEELGKRAREGSLALFIGAGTSIPAGAPSWGGLIDELADEAKLDIQTKAAFKDLGTLDQAELLHATLKDQMGNEIARRVDKLTPALAHVLLANLGCEGAVTTNYDRLYEDAVSSSGDSAATVLPAQVPPAGSRWLLKLHGDLKHPSTIVLTRSQFVGFTGASGPAGAVVQSLLLTKHLLVVGASMKDDNFLRLIYEVGAYRKRVHEVIASEGEALGKLEQFGTILSLSDDPARRLLYKPYFAWEVAQGQDDTERARQLEIFLDAVAMFGSNDYSWLLDNRYGYLLKEHERVLVEDVRELAAEIESAGGGPGSPWAVLGEALQQFGVRPLPGGSTVRPARRQHSTATEGTESEQEW